MKPRVLNNAAKEVYSLDRKEVWRESSGVARTAFAAHQYNEAFRRLGRHPRLIEPVMQLVDGPVYMHQYKVNAKAAFDGEVWQWHQDYGTWARDDEMPEPRAMNIAVFLDDVTAANGPLLFIPGSHKTGVFEGERAVTIWKRPVILCGRWIVRRLPNWPNAVVVSHRLDRRAACWCSHRCWSMPARPISARLVVLLFICRCAMSITISVNLSGTNGLHIAISHRLNRYPMAVCRNSSDRLMRMLRHNVH